MVKIMNSTKRCYMDSLYKQTVFSVKIILIQNYNLNFEEAEMAIKISPLKKIFKQDSEMAAHTSCERWAKEVYSFWIKKSKNINK